MEVRKSCPLSVSLEGRGWVQHSFEFRQSRLNRKPQLQRLSSPVPSPEISPCSTALGPARGYNLSTWNRSRTHVRSVRACSPSLNRGHPCSATSMPRETWAVSAIQTHSGRDG